MARHPGSHDVGNIYPHLAVRKQKPRGAEDTARTCPCPGVKAMKVHPELTVYRAPLQVAAVTAPILQIRTPRP